jgi:hypothetical protein
VRPCSTIWHYNYLHGYRDKTILRKQIERASSSQIYRYSYGGPRKNSRESRQTKIKSMMFGLEGDHEYDLEEIVLDGAERASKYPVEGE